MLGTWAGEPARLREDANHEHDLVLGGYRDRVIVELAQNAADAAARAGVPGRLLLQLTSVPTDDGALQEVLVAANTGAPLDAGGVAGLSTLRASAKVLARPVGDPDPHLSPETDPDFERFDPGWQTDSPTGLPPGPVVGRFGVGFAAVLAVCDEPVVASRTGSVLFSAARSAELLGEVAGEHPELSDELARLAGGVPALRLPFETDAEPPLDYDTAVILRLRDEVSADLVRDQLAKVGDPLLLALPALAEVVVIDGAGRRHLGDVASRWITASASGEHTAHDVADRPPEERARPGWRLTWALPRPGTNLPAEAVVCAPTPSQEPLAWPAMLIADLPLDPSRRHVAAGPAAAAVLAQAAQVYARLLAGLAADPAWVRDPLEVIPDGTPAGWLDATLRQQLFDALPGTACLRLAAVHQPVRPDEAVLLPPPVGDDPQVLAALSPALAGLVRAPARKVPLLQRLGVTRLDLAEVVDAWPIPLPGQWADSYARLATLLADPVGREALAALPVPLESDGEPRHVRGVARVLLPDADVPPTVRAVLAQIGAGLVAQEVTADPTALNLLVRLGARPLSARELLWDHEVERTVSRAADDDDSTETELEDLAAAVLDLVAAGLADDPSHPSSETAGGPSWLTGLPLPDAEGDLVEACLLVLPGSAMDAVLDPDELGRVDERWASRWPAQVWQACGVAAVGPVLVAEDEVDLGDPPERLAELDGFDDWLDSLLGEREVDLTALRVPGTVYAVRDLDLVRDPKPVRSLGPVRELEPDSAPAWPTLFTLLEQPEYSRVWQPVRIMTPDGVVEHVSYTVWWLRDRLRLAGTGVPGRSRDVPAWLPQAPEWTAGLRPGTRRALGIVDDLDDLDPAGWRDLLHRMGVLDDDGLALPDLLSLWRHLAAADLPAGVDLRVGRLWALDADDRPVLVATGDSGAPVVTDDPCWAQRAELGPRVLFPAAAVMRLADALDLDLASDRAPGLVSSTGTPTPLPAAVRDLAPDLPEVWFRHQRLLVDDLPVASWVSENGCHATDLDSLARALAVCCGRWGARQAFRALLERPRPDVLVDEAFG